MKTPPGKLKAYLLCRFASESSLYSSWIDQLPLDHVVVDQCESDWLPPEDAGIVIAHEHFRWEVVHALRKTLEQQSVPVLVLADGILEYRNTWQNPRIADGAMYQPLFADRIACIGNASARLIESWGNVGKTEVVGLPRLDSLIGARRKTGSKKDGDFRLLIATASTPAFDRDQRAVVIRSLVELKKAIGEDPRIENRAVQTTWCLTDGLAEIPELQGTMPEETPLSAAIENADAVITTPSTIYLESAIRGLPTAILDFTNSPQFVSSAWLLNSPDHFDETLKELADPPAAKILFQEFVLSDQLQCTEPAADRMVELVVRMVEIGQQQRSSRQPLHLPGRILEMPGEPGGSATIDRSELFPNNAAFQTLEVERLQAELSQLVARVGSLPRELADKNRQITQLQESLEESRNRVADVRARLFKLRKILGIGKENQP